MIGLKTWALLASAATGLCLSAAGRAQTAEPPASTEDTAASLEFLKAQVDAMQAQIEVLKKSSAAAAPTWKGAPEFGGSGFKFKVRGRVMYDTAFIENPENAVPTKNLGFGSRIRRARIGVEGAFPGDFSYKAEADFANNAVSWADLLLTYQAKGSPFSIVVGHMEPFENLEQPSSSRFLSFLERAQMSDGFNHGRRLGAAIGYATPDGRFRINSGIFNDTINATFDNDEWLFTTRATFSPKLGSNQLHFGLNFEHRRFQSDQQNGRYRARPFVFTTDQRFVDTGAFAAKGDNVYGAELAGIFGPFHAAGEIQFVKPDIITPGAVFTRGDAAGTTSRLGDDPTFVSYYAEVGYWLTGETRGYRNGLWDRTKVLNGFDKGGPGAFQINLRYDHLDLADAALRSGGVGTAANRGGKQTGYLASLVWQPIDYVRFMAQYTLADITGGPLAATVVPQSGKPVEQRGYSVNMFAVRAQWDF